MSQLLQRNGQGAYTAADGTAVPAYVRNGLPYDEGRALAVTTSSAISHYHQGLPFSAEGRLCVEDAPPTRVGNGATPFTATGRLAVVINQVVNLYVNPELAGGGVDTAATAHSVIFNTNGCDYAAIPDTAPQAFEFLSNTQDIDGRSVQNYDLAANNAGLPVGSKYRMEYIARSTNGAGYSAAITVTGGSGLNILASRRGIPSSGIEVPIYYEFEITDAVYTGGFRVGCGTTANNIVQMAAWKPSLTQIDPPDHELPTAYNAGVPYSSDGRVILTGLP